MPQDRAAAKRSPANTGLRKFFEAAVRFEASDLLLRGGLAPKLRLRGALKSLDTPIVEIPQFEEFVEASLSESQWKRYATHGSVDIGFDLDLGGPTQIHRFRVNVFRTRGRSAIAARRVSNKILNFEQLYLPPVLGTVAEQLNGMVLLAGVTGSGKSTTIAAMLQRINENRPCHILTLEDPIEYLYTDAKAMFNQREIGLDCSSFPEGLKALVRENPDVVFIGEMRDRETFEAALHAAETGHLVFGTIHASSASQAFGRIYDLFPQAEREAIRNMLAYQMSAFVYQKLLPTIREDIQRVPAVEILLQSAPTRKFILEGREHELSDVIRQSKESGMQTFTDSLISLVQKGFIHPRIAQANAANPEELKMALKGIITR
ncbi:MAG: PilT/PilU family type 4a pilus ATPase [Planctomycetota bacterium]|nr:PilT/PilU family type 4a pilus ATPase [Planctomycetota bacterium]